MSMSTARDASLDWAQRALLEELHGDPGDITARAENMVAIAEHHQVPIEELIRWIHERCAGKSWSAAEWRRYSQQYAELRTRLGLGSDVSNPCEQRPD
jgi:hypothetical protein